MQLFFLNPGPAVAGTGKPNYYGGAQAITDYSSLIWTERFRDYGEFQLNIPRASPSSEILWPGRLLGIQESHQVMLAETQQEQVNEQGYREMIITGRSAEAIIEDRVLWAPQGTTLTLAREYSDLDAALVYIWQAVMNSTTTDVGYTVPRPVQICAYNAISSALVTDSVKVQTTPYHKINVDVGQIGPVVRQFLLAGKYGLRCLRPPTDVTGIYSVTVDPANGPNKGAITKSSLSGTNNNLRFDVYQGIDRSKTPPTDDDFVYLSSEAGHLENIDVATTYKEFITNVVFGIDESHYYGNTSPLTHSVDFYERHRFVDVSSLTQGTAVGEYPSVISKALMDYWQTHTNRAILSADLTSKTPFVFGRDYNLGDTVMIRYKDRTRRALVDEYVRVDDGEGSKEYPRFVGWDEITEGAPVRDW